MMLLGFSGFGDAAADGSQCDPNTQYWDGSNCVSFNPYNGQCTSSQYWDSGSGTCVNFPAGSGSASAAKNATPSVASSSSWWSTALTALTKGVVQGASGPGAPVPCVSPGVPAGCITITPVTPPWYTTPMGIGGIVLTLGLGYFLLKK